MMRFQVPSRTQSLNHKPIPRVNSLASKLIDGKSIHPAPLINVSELAENGTYNYKLERFLLPHQGVVIWWKRSQVLELPDPSDGCSRTTTEWPIAEVVTERDSSEERVRIN